jgi:hypothetical protein
MAINSRKASGKSLQLALSCLSNSILHARTRLRMCIKHVARPKVVPEVSMMAANDETMVPSREAKANLGAPGAPRLSLMSPVG